MRGPLSYIGGKRRLAKTICTLFPQHTTYVEPFAGGAQVFFYKGLSEVEVINDLNSDIVNFFRVCQSHHEELYRCIKFMVVSRKWYADLKRTDPDTLTDVQRAARFFYLLKNSFGGNIVRSNYAAKVIQKPNFNPAKLQTQLQLVQDRLKTVQIECLPYDVILEKYDRPTTLFYLDPPYWGRQFYKYNLSTKDFQQMEKQLRGLKGKFILSLNDLPEVRKLFSRFHIQAIKIPYSSQRQAGKRYGELIITNYKTTLNVDTTQTALE